MTKRAARAKRDALATDPANLALVVSIAKRVHESLPAWFDLKDLIGDGMVGLLIACDSHDPARAPWNYWARTKIRGAILDSIGRREDDKHGHTANKFLENCRPSIDELFTETRRGPCTTTDRHEQDVPLSERGRALARMAHQPTAPAAIDRARRNRRVSEALSWLPERERTILSLTYADDEPHPRLIARLMGMSLNEAQTLHDSAIAGLRARLNGEALPKAS